MSSKILDKDLKIFAIWWVILAVVSWFGPLMFVLGILQKHQDREAWLLVLSLAILLTGFGHYGLLRWWFMRAGLGKVAPIYLPIKSGKWIAAGYAVELSGLLLMIIGLAEPMFGADPSLLLYAGLAILVPSLLFWRPKDDNPPITQYAVIGTSIYMLFGFALIFFLLPGDQLTSGLRSISSPILWLILWGFLIVLLKGALLFAGFRQWQIFPGVEERYDLKLSRRAFGMIFLGVFAFLGLRGNFFERGNHSQLLGLQPCGWQDLRLGHSHCVQSWFVDQEIEGPSLSPDGRQLAVYDNALKQIQIRSVESGEITGRLSIEIFDEGFALPSFIFSPDGSLLLFRDLDFGVYLWDMIEDKLTPLGPAVGAEHDWGYRFSSDGEVLVFGVDDELIVWDTRTHRTINSITTIDNYMRIVGVDEAVLIITQEEILRWDYRSSKELVLVEKRDQNQAELYSVDLYDATGEVYTLMEIEDQFYLTHDGRVSHLPLIETVVADLITMSPKEFEEAGFGGYMVFFEMSISPNGEYLILSRGNWFSVHRTNDGARLFWANPCGDNQDCNTWGTQITDQGLVLVYPDENLQIWSVDR